MGESVVSLGTSAATTDAPPTWGTTGRGVVASWSEDGGYGFLNMEDGRRAYIHRSMFGGTGSLAVGTSLLVSTRPDSRNPGKICVDEVLAGDIIYSRDPIGAPPSKKI